MNHPNRSVAGALAVFAVSLILAGGIKAVSSQVSGTTELLDFFRGLHECSSGHRYSDLVDR